MLKFVTYSIYSLLLSSTVLLSYIEKANAAVITFNAIETESGVLFEGSGSIDLTGLIRLGTGGVVPQIDPSGGTLVASIGGTSLGSGDRYQVDGRFPSFGTSALAITNIDVFTGTGAFGLQANPPSSQLYVPFGYQSLDPINGSIVFLDETFASLGLIAGLYEFEFGNNQWFLNIDEPNPIPLPAAFWFFGSGAIAMIVGRRRAKATTE